MRILALAFLFCLISSIADAQESVPAFTDTVMKDTSQTQIFQLPT